LAAIWSNFLCAGRDKRICLRDAAFSWLRLPPWQLHPVKLKPAADVVLLVSPEHQPPVAHNREC